MINFLSLLIICLGCGTESSSDEQTQGSVIIDDFGWTVITPASDSRIVYVSSSEGDDDNDGLSAESPKKTIVAADELIRNGHPDHLLLKRGDVFPVERNILLGAWKSGRSEQEPVVLSYYGDSGPRPVVKVSARLVDHDGENRNYQAFIGIDIYKSNSDPGSPDFTNTSGTSVMRFTGGGRDLLIEDCRIRFGMITIQSHGGFTYRNPKLRRNIVTDAWAHGSSHGHDGRIQGIYMSGVDNGYLFEENFFDHNGWSQVVDGAGANMYNHNIYIQYSNVEGGIIRGNIISRGAAHGIQARSGGVVEKNLIALNAVSLNMGGHGEPTVPAVYDFPNKAAQNVIISGRLMNPDNTEYPRTPALWGINASFFHSTFEDNIIANRIHDGSNAAFNTAYDGSFTLVGNIVYNWHAAYDSTDATWPHPDHDLGDYHESIGGANSTVDYLEWLRERPLKTMPWDMTAYAAINYIRSGFNREPVEEQFLYNNLP